MRRLGLRLGLRGRLIATSALAATVAVAMLVVGLQVFLARQTSRESLSTLRGRADAVAATIRFQDGRFKVLETRTEFLDQNVWIFDGKGARVDGRVPPRPVRADVARLGTSRVERAVDLRERFRLLARPVVPPGGGPARAVIVTALDLAPYESAERRGLWASLALGLLAIVVAGAAASAASGSALGQVRRMARRADGWREHDLSGRFDLGPPRDELTELAATLDGMLDRITQAILAERRLTDEVAHELRTPLSVIRTEAQLAQLQSDRVGVPEESLSSILAAVSRMTASIDTMLAVARSAQSDEKRCVVADLMFELRSHAAAPSGGHVDVDDPEGQLLIGAPLRVVAAAAMPVLDNAVRHARSRVRVGVTTDDRRVVVHVEDDGDGVGEQQVDQVFEPGHTTVEDGAGLGLSLARRLVRSVGGEVDALPGHTGHFTLSLPRA